MARIDQLNGEDPNQEVVGGIAHPRELLYAQRLTDWVLRLVPDASEALRIAARGQHVRRWTIPRGRYPMNRQGYLRWRETLKTFHAQTVGGLMREAGYADDDIQRVQRLMSKRELGKDSDTQVLEDALCLVFIQTQFSDLRRKTAAEKMQEVVRKTWQKMSAQARAEAARLALTAEDRAIIQRAVL